ncbi:MAG: PLDc N-terminal domain-containing protein [Candidatus Woesearchaeota archaeon]
MLNTILWILGIVCMVWVIYDVLANNKKLSTTAKVLWIIAAVLFSVITAIVYYFVAKK